MSGQFDKETSNKNYEWHRERLLREKKEPNAFTKNRIDYNLKAIAAKHGDKAANEAARELGSKSRNSSRKYFT